MGATAVILAAGLGRRMGRQEENVPKQLVPLGDKPMVAYSIELFNNLPCIDALCIVTRPELRDAIADLDAVQDLKKPLYWATGGARRQDSALNGVLATPKDSDVLCVHDAARPFPPPMAVIQACQAAAQAGGAIIAIPITDTVKQVHDGVIGATLDRDALWLAQTPQVFQRDLLLRALTRAAETDAPVTDEASAVEALGEQAVIIIQGSKHNFKITTTEDLAMAEALLRVKS